MIGLALAAVLGLFAGQQQQLDVSVAWARTRSISNFSFVNRQEQDRFPDRGNLTIGPVRPSGNVLERWFRPGTRFFLPAAWSVFYGWAFPLKEPP